MSRSIGCREEIRLAKYPYVEGMQFESLTILTVLADLCLTAIGGTRPECDSCVTPKAAVQFVAFFSTV
jgi:hypothetical protein